MLRHALTPLAALACLTAGLMFPATAEAATSPGAAALDWAEGHATGHPYVWAGTGPYGFDCSGLVMESYLHADSIRLPHNTVAMLDSGLLERTNHPQRGDLAYFGTGHVELVTGLPDTTFGAHDTGSRVGFIRDGGDFRPTAYYRVRLARSR